MDFSSFFEDRSKKIIVGRKLDDIVLITKMAPFIEEENEPLEVGVILVNCFIIDDILPKITEHSGKELASRCLVSLSFFKPALEKQHVRHGAPSPEFYKNVGIAAFREINLNGLANNFQKWNSFLFEQFN